MSADGRTWDEMLSVERRAVLDGIVAMVIMAGGRESTAYTVAADFARGLEPPPEPRRNRREKVRA